MMDVTEVLQWVLGIGLTVLGWFARQLWGAVQELKQDLAELKEELPIYYVRKDDFKEFRHSIMEALQRIENLLYQKADK
jgi:hypothetical protein